MPRLEFGNTWWGEKWLDALTNIDYENRLPRGKSYARGSAVLSINITQNQIKARVQGSRRTPYKVLISIPEFSQKEKSNIIKTITGNKFILAQLMIRQLPSELYEHLQKEKIKLFPRRWNDMDAYCSCPDWALPCKHIAAVIYLIANKIDKNPFLVFELHNFNIFKDLEKQGYSKQETTKTNILSLNDIFKFKEKHKRSKLNIKTIKKFDFSRIPYTRDQIFLLLHNKPVFYLKADFKLYLEKLYKKLPKEFCQFRNDFDKEKTWQRNTEEYTQLKIILNSNLKIQNLTLSTKNNRFKILCTKKQDNLIDFLESIPYSKISYHSDKIIALNLIYSFAWRLAEQGAFIPQLIQLTEKTYQIIWIPCLIDAQTQDIFQKLLEIMPCDMLNINIKIKNKKELKNPCLEHQLKLLISLFLEYFINLTSLEINLPEYDSIIDLFFKSRIFKSNNAESEEIPHLINLWLGKFFIKHKIFVPVLKINAEKNNFKIQVLVENIQKQLSRPEPLSKIFTDKSFNNHRADIMRDLILLSNQFPEMQKIIQSEGRQCLEFNSKEFAQVFFKALPSIKLLGLQILLPKELKEIIRPKISLSLKNKSKSKNLKTYLSLDKMLDFDWQIALGNKFISKKEMIKLMQESFGIVKFKDQYIYIDDAEIKNLLKKIKHGPKFSSHELLKTALAQEYNNAPLNISNDTIDLIKSLLKIKKISLPDKLIANLRPYQKTGYWWLYKNSKIGFGSLIADDMGLGKTLQVIALCLKLKEQGLFQKYPGLIIVPTTLLTNWQKEIEKFAPDLKTHVYHGTDRRFDKSKNDLIITTYGLIRRDLKKINKYKWPLVVIDEAQNIKNTDTAQTRAVKSIKSQLKIAMTGTPVENRLSEYFSIMDFLNKGYLGSFSKFNQEYSREIEIYRNQNTLEKFKKITSPFILRRLKTDKNIIKDLPEKNEINQFCSLSREQALLYKSVVDENMKKIETSEGIERKGLVFKLMTALKQICNHPAHFLKKKTADPDISGKTALLLDILQTIYENDEKALLFTQYTEMGKLLIKILENKFKFEVLFLHGGVPRKKRDELVDRFQFERQLNILLLSLKAGGTGLNLTAASNVIHFDLWWNPAVETQATDRAYRIGQVKNVMVHRLIVKNTFEEKINQMIQDKKELAKLTVTSGEKWIGEFSNKELRDLFQIQP